MFTRRTALSLARQARLQTRVSLRPFSASVARQGGGHGHSQQPDLMTYDSSKIKTLSEIKQDADLLPPGAPQGSVPTDMNQATGLERIEILGKMEGRDVWDLKPLDASRLGTMHDPHIVKSIGQEQYVGCTGVPRDSHDTLWMTCTREDPYQRCAECGNVVKMEYVGPADDGHHHEEWKPDLDPGFHYDHVYQWREFVNYLKPEYNTFKLEGAGKPVQQK